MDINYSFLKDELAILEIRKHKWIESEKCGHEIGFATAAVDWIKKYGHDWKLYRLGIQNEQNVFSEKRQYRRFRHQVPVHLLIKNQPFSTYTSDINLVGLNCIIPRHFSPETETEVTVLFHAPQNLYRQSSFNFKSKILRISKLKNGDGPSRYSIFIAFNEEARDYLRIHLKDIEHQGSHK